MDFQLDLLKQSRKNMLGLMQPFSTEQLNQVPTGFKNNLAWNLGHVIVSQQILCYQFSGLPFCIPEDIVAQFRRGTAPEQYIDQTLIDQMKSLALKTVDTFVEDYQNGIFVQYQAYQSLYGVKINHIQDAIVFNNTHEGLHLGYMMAIRKMITQ
jgi:hypothetical protein